MGESKHVGEEGCPGNEGVNLVTQEAKAQFFAPVLTPLSP